MEVGGGDTPQVPRDPGWGGTATPLKVPWGELGPACFTKHTGKRLPVSGITRVSMSVGEGTKCVSTVCTGELLEKFFP